MKSKLRSVNTRFWDDPFIEELNPSEKLLFLYLLTNSLTNLLGIYEITIKRITFDTGLTRETILKALKGFESVGKVFYIDGFIVLPNFLKNQRLNPNMVKNAISEFNDLPEWLKNRILNNSSGTTPNGLETISNALQTIRKEEGEEEEGNEEEVNLPEDDFKPIILEWMQYKAEKKQSYKPRGLKEFISHIRKISNNNPAMAKEIIKQSMRNNWAGIFELKEQPKEKQPGPYIPQLDAGFKGKTI